MWYSALGIKLLGTVRGAVSANPILHHFLLSPFLTSHPDPSPQTDPLSQWLPVLEASPRLIISKPIATWNDHPVVISDPLNLKNINYIFHNDVIFVDKMKKRKSRKNWCFHSLVSCFLFQTPRPCLGCL